MVGNEALDIDEIKFILKEKLAFGLEEGLETISNALDNRSKLLNDYIILKNNYVRTYQIFLSGLIDFQELQLTQNRICKALLEIIDRFDFRDIKTSYQHPSNLNNNSEGEKRNKIEVEITIQGDFDSFGFNERQKVQNAIETFLSINEGELRIKRIYKGSIKLLIETTESNFRRLNFAIRLGVFNDFEIIDINRYSALKKIKKDNELSVLLAMSNGTVRFLISAELENRLVIPFNINFANNGKEAFDKILTKEYDLLVTDTLLPLMTGKELVENIRRLDNITPIIVLSRNQSEFEQELFLNLGATRYLDFDPEKLRFTIMELFEWKFEEILK